MRKILIGSAIAAAMLSQQTLAAGTGAATDINNTATATYTIGANSIASQSSTTATFKVDEILDITGTTTALPTVTTPETDASIAYTVTNTGNGEEDFTIALTTSQTWSTVIYLENNANTGYQPLEDIAVFTPATSKLNLLADGVATFYVVTQVPTGLADGLTNVIDVTVGSDTAGAAGSAAGTVLAGLGTSGVAAVVGTTTAQYTSSHTFTVSDIKFGTGANAFLKVIDGAPTFPGNAALDGQFIPGAEVTYKITFGLTGTATANNFVVTDAIPATMTFVPGSVVVNTVGILDGATTGNVTVGLTAPNKTVTFATLNAASGLQTILLKAKIN